MAQLRWYCGTCGRNHSALTWQKRHDLEISLEDLQEMPDDLDGQINLFFGQELLRERDDAKETSA